MHFNSTKKKFFELLDGEQSEMMPIVEVSEILHFAERLKVMVRLLDDDPNAVQLGAIEHAETKDSGSGIN